MAKMMQVDVVDDTVTPPEEFKAKYQVVDGKKVLVVETRNEVINRADGSRDVIIHAPTLELMNKFIESQ